jgi:uncharacterized membrane protein
MIESDPLGFALVLAAMAFSVYIMRAGGYWLIGRVTIGPRLKRMLDALPGAVVSATIAPFLIKGDLGAFMSIAAAAGAMILARNDFAAVLAGVATAAAVRFAGF